MTWFSRDIDYVVVGGCFSLMHYWSCHSGERTTHSICYYAWTPVYTPSPALALSLTHDQVCLPTYLTDPCQNNAWLTQWRTTHSICYDSHTPIYAPVYSRVSLLTTRWANLPTYLTHAKNNAWLTPPRWTGACFSAHKDILTCLGACCRDGHGHEWHLSGACSLDTLTTKYAGKGTSRLLK